MTDTQNTGRSNAGQFKIKHGESDPPTPEYEAWHAMKARCLNPTDAGFQNYGARGISICKKWIASYEQFLKDMGRKPSSSHSLDRIDNDGNYEPDNCRWATRSEQQQNKRIGRPYKTNSSGMTGVSWHKGNNKWEAYFWERNRKKRIGYFDSFEDAVAARHEWEKRRTK